MRLSFIQKVIQGIGLLIILGIQIYSSYWQFLFKQKIELLDFNISTLTIGLIEVALDVVSGILLAMIFFSRTTQTKSFKTTRNVLLLGVFLPLIAVIIKGVASLNGFSMFSMNFMYLWDWAIFSPVPSLWLGVALLSLIQSYKT